VCKRVVQLLGEDAIVSYCRRTGRSHIMCKAGIIDYSVSG
jgi:hypothetical protein